MRIILKILVLMSLVLSGCNSFRPLRLFDSTRVEKMPLGEVEAIVSEEELHKINDAMALLEKGDPENAQDKLGELAEDPELADDAVIENLLGISQMLLGNYEGAKERFRYALDLIDSSRVPQAESSLNNPLNLPEKTTDERPLGLSEDKKIVAVFLAYVRNEREAPYVFEALKQRRKIIPFPPTYVGPVGLCMEVIQEYLGKPYFAPQVASYPKVGSKLTIQIGRMKRAVAVNLLIAAILSRDLSAVDEARQILLGLYEYPNNLVRFHLGLSELLLQSGREKQYFWHKEMALFSN